MIEYYTKSQKSRKRYIFVMIALCVVASIAWYISSLTSTSEVVSRTTPLGDAQTFDTSKISNISIEDTSTQYVSPQPSEKNHQKPQPIPLPLDKIMYSQ